MHVIFNTGNPRKQDMHKMTGSNNRRHGERVAYVTAAGLFRQHTNKGGDGILYSKVSNCPSLQTKI